MEESNSSESNSEVTITYESLFELLRREKDGDEPQELQPNFFKEVLDYLKDKQNILDQGNDDNLFASDEKEKTRIQLENIKQILKEIYNRREKKILSMAINKSRTSSNIIDTSVLLNEERELFESVVKKLNKYREGILHNILLGKAPSIVIKAMGPEGAEEKDELPHEAADSEEAESSEETESVGAVIDVKFLDAVPKFVGTELEEYGPFEAGDEAKLPAEIANVLVKKGKAEEN